jgi:DNA mismatch repair protein MutS
MLPEWPECLKAWLKGRCNILKELEKSHNRHSLTKPVASLAEQREGFQLSMFQLDDPVLKQIRDEIINLDINNLTPVEALNKLNDIKKISPGNKIGVLPPPQ